MYKRLKETFLMTDVDGTLLNDNHQISEKNKEAINELVNAGGFFTIATGRGISMAKPIITELDLKLPAVIFNGAAVYDTVEDKILWSSSLPKEVLGYLKAIHNEFPTCAVEVLSHDTVWVPYINELERQHLSLGNVTPRLCDIDDLTGHEWIKCLIVDEPETIDKMIGFIEKRGFDNVHWVRSSPTYYEMLPLGVNKGAGFKKLLEIMGCDDKFIVTAGDYMNDTEMLQMADLGVAVENAQTSVKEAADIIVTDNNHNSIYEIVEYLKRMD